MSYISTRIFMRKLSEPLANSFDYEIPSILDFQSSQDSILSSIDDINNWNVCWSVQSTEWTKYYLNQTDCRNKFYKNKSLMIRIAINLVSISKIQRYKAMKDMSGCSLEELYFLAKEVNFFLALFSTVNFYSVSWYWILWKWQWEKSWRRVVVVPDSDKDLSILRQFFWKRLLNTSFLPEAPTGTKDNK